MKKIVNYIIAMSLLVSSSCSDYLDKSPLDQFGEDAIWQDINLMETFVNNIYWNLYHGFDGKIGMQMLCDESVRASDRGAGNVTKSMVNPSDYQVFGSQVGQQKLCWNHLYKYIRACNLFLDNIQKNSYSDMEFVNRLAGEVHFLRAFNYYTLVIQYGGVPVIDKVYSLTDDPMIARNSLEETIAFAVEECNLAAGLLKAENTDANKGRATKGAALALKSRILLYAASELANNPSWANGYEHPELIAYTGGDRAARWRAAKEAAKAVIDMNVYALHKAEPGPDDDIVRNLDEVYLLKETSEDIFIRFFMPKTWDTETYQPGLQYSSGGYHCQGSNNPTQNAVDAYQMIDGNAFDWDNPAHKAAPYKNREPRFYSNILYDGAPWRQRPDDVIALDPVGIIQTGYYENADGSKRGGLDTRNSVVEDWNCTYSGYYQKKQIDPSVAPWFDVQALPWRYFRYAEILLNYAEACNELGEDAEAARYVNMIRKRAGLPGIGSTGNQLRTDIRHERQIEFMFEGHRYWDIRRWMIAPQVMSNYAQAIDILYKYGETVPVYQSKNIPDRQLIWLDQSYFMPIQLSEMNKNNQLIQNPLYK
jgi:hypothetical protein